MVLKILINSLLVIHVIVALLLILVVLMQRPKNEGLGAAFGGGMTDNLFGAQTTNVLQTFTRNLGILFFVLAVVLSVLYAMQSSASSEVDRRLREKPAPPVVDTTPAKETPVVAAESTPDAAAGATPGASATSGTNDSEKTAPETEALPTVNAQPSTKELEGPAATPESTPAEGE